MVTKLFTLLAAVLSVLFLCTGLAAAPIHSVTSRKADVAPVCTLAAGWHNVVINGQTRHYLVGRPAKITTRVPAVISVHGMYQTAASNAAATRLSQLGVAKNFMTIFPEASGLFRIWDTAPTGSDMLFMRTLFTIANRSGCINPARIYMTGFSQGAMMSTELACHWPTLVAGVGLVGGVIPTSGCVGGKKVPTVVMHGTWDIVLWYNGGMSSDTAAKVGARYQSGTTRAQLAFWIAARNGCNGGIGSRIGVNVTAVAYRCPAGAQVTMITVDKGSHTWFGDPANTRVDDNFDATKQLLKTFNL